MPGEERPLHVVYYVDSLTWGGAEQVLLTLLSALPASIRATVVGADPVICRRVASGRPGTRVVVLAYQRRSDPRSWWEIVRLLDEVGADVVHINLTWPLAGLPALVAVCMVPQLRVVAHEHLPMPLKSRGRAVLKRLLSRRIDAHVVVSHRAADDLARWTGLPRSSLVVVPNGVADVGPGGRTRVDPRPTVLAMGRFSHQKAFDVMIEAMVSVPGAALLLVGYQDAAQRDQMLTLAKAAGVEDRLHLRPWDPLAREWLGAADLLGLSSRLEAAPLVLLEAMMAGVPVVSTDVGNARQLLGELNPRLVTPVDDPHALGEAIRWVLEDRWRRVALGQAGQRLVKRTHSAQAMANAFTTLYGMPQPAGANAKPARRSPRSQACGGLAQGPDEGLA